MKIEDVIRTEIMNLRMGTETKQKALDEMIEMLFKAGRIDDRERLMEKILKREEMENTDLGFGVAIPHGISDSVKQASVAIGKLETPIEWGTESEENHEPVYAIFLMVSSPDEKGKAHLEIISKVATLLIEDEFVDFLKENNDKELLVEKIISMIGEG